MSPLHFYRDAYRAITDFGYYREVFDQPLHRTLTYLALLTVHAALISSLAMAFYHLPWISRGLAWAQHNFPVLVFTDGRLSVPEAESGGPLTREYLGQSVWTFVFDPNGSQNTNQVRQPAVVLTPEKCFLMVDAQTQMSWAWRDVIVTATVGPDLWERLSREAGRLFVPFAFAGFLLLYLVVKPFQAALLTFFSVVAAVRMGLRLPFSHHFSICCYALTPAVAIDLVLQAANLLGFMDFLPIYLATAAVYAYRATQHCLQLEA